MKKVFFVVWILCLMTNIAIGAEALLMPDGTRLEDIRETYAAPDLGVNIGKADMVQGKAVVIHSGSPAAFWIKEDIPLFKDDAIITLKGGRIRLQLNDGSILTMASESKLVLNQSVFDPDAQTRSAFINMAFGKARFFVKKLKEITDTNFKIKTRTAVVGIRGSDFIITADAASTEVVTLDDTRLEVVSLTDPNMNKTVLNNYERIVVDQNALPSAIESVSLEEAKKIMKGLDISIDKIQAGTEKISKGFEGKEPAVPEKAKDDNKPTVREKSDVKQSLAAVPTVVQTEKARAEVRTEGAAMPQQPVPLVTTEPVKIQTPEKTDVKITSQEKISVPLSAPTVDLPKFEASTVTAAPDVKVNTVEKVAERAAIPVAVIELPKVETVEKPVVQDVIRSTAASVVIENKDNIQKVAEVKVQSANDTTIKDKAADSSLQTSPVNTTQPPVAGNTTTQPVTGNTTTQPVAGNTTTQPVTGNTTTQPVAGNTTTQPVTGNTVIQPVAGNTTTQPVTGTTTTQPVPGNTVIQPVAGNTTTPSVVRIRKPNLR